MAQDDLLLPWLSLRENVALGARLRAEAPDRARIDAALARAGLSEHASKRPGALSGGQRQRGALARTLMEDRPVALLDEPFSALDALSRLRMQDLAAEALRGRTVLHVTHDPAEAVRMGHAVVIMGPEGLTHAPVPAGPPPRPVAADAVLRAQAALLERMRGGA